MEIASLGQQPSFHLELNRSNEGNQTSDSLLTVYNIIDLMIDSDGISDDNFCPTKDQSSSIVKSSAEVRVALHRPLEISEQIFSLQLIPRVKPLIWWYTQYPS